MNKKFIVIILGLLLSFNISAEEQETFQILKDLPDSIPSIASIEQITQGPKHHFFGYYNILPWSGDGTKIVCMESDFSDRLVEDDDIATIGLVDLKTNTFKALTTTRSWNFQQGALVHWVATEPNRDIIYNDRIEGKLSSVILNTDTGDKLVLPQPIAAVAPNGEYAASISYARLRHTRPGYGYAGSKDPYVDDPHPEEDGLFLMDLKTGKSKMVVSLDQVHTLDPFPEGFEEATMWFNHILFSRDSQRLFFLARYRLPGKSWYTSVFTVGIDGSHLRQMAPYTWGGSHFDWRNGEQLVVTTRYKAGKKWLHVLMNDTDEKEMEVLAGDELQHDGHCHYSYDGKWMVTDSYPRKDRMQSLYIYNHETKELGEIAKFLEPRVFSGAWRCDLHPSWNLDSTQICIDSTHNGSRQIYIVKLEK